MKIQALTILSFLAAATAIQGNSILKRTNNHKTQQNIDTRLASLWDESEKGEDFDWYESIEHFLRESSMSHSHSSSGSSDVGGDHIMMTDPMVSILSDGPTSAPMITAKPLSETSPSGNEPKSVASSVTSTETLTANPTANPTATPSQHAVQETAAKSPQQSEPELSFSDDTNITKGELKSNSLRICPTETEEGNGSDASGIEDVSVSIINFSYAAETKTQGTDFIAPLEEAIVDAVAAVVLKCEAHSSDTGNRMLRKMPRPVRRQLAVVGIDSIPTDTVSTTETCTPSDPEAAQCLVINGHITLGVDDTSIAKAERETLSYIQQYMYDGTFLSPTTLPDLIKVTYLEPNAEQIVGKAKSEETATITNTKSALPYVILGSVGFVVLAVLSVLVLRRNKSNEEAKESEEKFEEDTWSGISQPSPSNSVNDETESDSEGSKDVENKPEHCGMLNILRTTKTPEFGQTDNLTTADDIQ